MKRTYAIQRLHTPAWLAAAIMAAACTSQSMETTFNNQEGDIADYAGSIRFTECEFIQDKENPEFNEDGSPKIVRSEIRTFSPTVTHNGGATRLTIIDGEGSPLKDSGTATIYFAGYVFESGPNETDIAVTDIDGTGETWLLSTPYTSFTVSSSEAGVTIGGSGSARGLTLFATNHYATAALSGWSLSQGDFSPMTVDLGSGDLVEGLQAGLPGVRAGEVCDILFSGRYGLGKKPLGTVPANSALLYRIWVVSISE